MTEKWRYQACGKEHGPFTVEEMKARAARGELGPDDVVWPEGADPGDGMPAEQAIDFSSLTPTAPPALPDWLADVQTAAAETASRPESPAPETIPDWLQELILQEPEKAPAQEPPAPDEEAAHSPEPSSEEVESEAAAFFFETLNEETPPSTAEAEVEDHEITVEPELPAPTPQILETPRRRIETAQEAWHRARVALDRWIDLDANRDMVLDGDVEALLQDPDVRELIEPLQRFGPVLVDRLVQHLAFLAENRRKYYVALSKKLGGS